MFVFIVVIIVEIVSTGSASKLIFGVIIEWGVVNDGYILLIVVVYCYDTTKGNVVDSQVYLSDMSFEIV